jgi:hypothetical protein
MFTVEYRVRVKEHVLLLAQSDPRVVAGAIIGSLAHDGGDQWSDLDLTFAVDENVRIQDVLEDWTEDLVDEFDAVKLLDLPSGSSIYRVFFFPGALQFDLSFTPASVFGARGPKFKLLFGKSGVVPKLPMQPTEEVFGYAVHHAMRARFCIERGRFWQAEFWISATRDYAMSLACRRHELPSNYGRGFDDLPPEVLESHKRSLVTSLDRAELLRALGAAMDGLFQETTEVREMAAKIEPHLRELANT